MMEIMTINFPFRPQVYDQFWPAALVKGLLQRPPRYLRPESDQRVFHGRFQVLIFYYFFLLKNGWVEKRRKAKCQLAKRRHRKCRQQNADLRNVDKKNLGKMSTQVGILSFICAICRKA